LSFQNHFSEDAIGQVSGLRCIAFSRDGMLAATGGYGKKVVVWDLDL
jgi:hypothetical protein